MKTNKILLLVVFIIGFIALRCKRIFDSVFSPTNDDTLSDQHLTLGDTLSIAYQDTLFNHEEDIWLLFDSLITDSRCPIGVLCIWKGNAEVSLTFNSISFHLNTNTSFTSDTTISTFHIDLIDVQPYPHIDSLYTDKQYSVENRAIKSFKVHKAFN